MPKSSPKKSQYAPKKVSIGKSQYIYSSNSKATTALSSKKPSVRKTNFSFMNRSVTSSVPASPMKQNFVSFDTAEKQTFMRAVKDLIE